MVPGWTRTESGGKPVDRFEPSGALPFVLVWLHDESGAMPAADPAFTAELAAQRLSCAAPHAARSWWVDRVCPEFDPHLTAERHLIENIVPGLGTRRVAIAGAGMGGHGALRLAFRNPQLFPVAASIDGALDFHEQYGRGTPLDEMYPSRESTRQDCAILHIHGHVWPPHIYFACSLASEHHRGNDRLHEKLTALGVPHTAELDAPPDVHRLVTPMFAFVAAALEREARRLA